MWIYELFNNSANFDSFLNFSSFKYWKSCLEKSFIFSIYRILKGILSEVPGTLLDFKILCKRKFGCYSFFSSYHSKIDVIKVLIYWGIWNFLSLKSVSNKSNCTKLSSRNFRLAARINSYSWFMFLWNLSLENFIKRSFVDTCAGNKELSLFFFSCSSSKF